MTGVFVKVIRSEPPLEATDPIITTTSLFLKPAPGTTHTSLCRSHRVRAQARPPTVTLEMSCMEWPKRAPLIVSSYCPLTLDTRSWGVTESISASSYVMLPRTVYTRRPQASVRL